jgi:hypothetical protein
VLPADDPNDSLVRSLTANLPAQHGTARHSAEQQGGAHVSALQYCLHAGAN